MTRQLHLVGFLKPAGEYPSGWRHRAAAARAGVDFGFVAEQARRLEAAAFDAVFVPDLVGVPDVDPEVLARVAVVNDSFEPLTLLAALSAVTERIGLIATASVSFGSAEELGRDIAALHRLSAGRAGWNVVTSLSDAEARNFGRSAHLPHAERYVRAADVVRRASERWGRDRPVLAQAGSSDAGRDLAARVADIVFVRALPVAETREFVADIRARATAHGRDGSRVRVLPELSTVVAPTRDEARASFARMRELLDPRVALADLEYWTGSDLSALPMSSPLPPLRAATGSRGAQLEIYRQAARDGLTIGDLVRLVAEGDGAVVGSPADVADHIEQYANEADVDGFTVSFPWLPGTLTAFTELVVPELRRRGAFRTHYEGETIREHLGLSESSCQRP
ncbi:LLM class flavin-dependent oxidoreductase [Microbacterium sp. SORGH_AS_0862]|uniref:LLM class flavin-dependent oxidoreductase n=1 Tax=Microbacterium sp. SORGH_AS_0862 TaxID=3041789 RepID=UPI00278EED41|nr:LLM class flavin-dependent oxidoreductase [Microbacterium sp. SORGH_AS_0862]MDQ1205721.1 alkanesulfonate monooxygenase SsuD/methylene tetrahydromethanopterin reductase-like flavin-dependent oxidoreductase (luciferase family) [Microbacterium sp. SORGH_AS_0862]